MNMKWTEKEIRYLKDNYTFMLDKEIARKLHRQPNCVTIKRISLGLTIKNRKLNLVGQRHPNYKNISKDLLVQKLIIEKKPLLEVCKEIGCVKKTLYRKIKKYNIDRSGVIKEVKSNGTKKQWENNPTRREATSKWSIQQWQDIDFQNKIKQVYYDPKNMEKRRLSVQTQECREKMKIKNRETGARPEVREIRRRTATKLMSDPKMKEHIKNKLKEKLNNEDYHQKLSKIRKEVMNRPEMKKHRSQLMAERYKDISFREKMCKIQKEVQNRPDVKTKRSKKMKEKWQKNPYKQLVIEKMLKGLLIRPTSLEKLFMDLCEKHKLPFVYTGDGKLLINFKNPDFVDLNKRKVIEVANTFPLHHDPKFYEDDRTKKFSAKGFDTLVLWDTDFYDPKETPSNRKLNPENEGKIVKKVKKFMEGN